MALTGVAPQARNMSSYRALPRSLKPQDAEAAGMDEGIMAGTREDRRIVESANEARQAEPGPSVLALLTISTGLAVLILGLVWFVFFRT